MRIEFGRDTGKLLRKRVRVVHHIEEIGHQVVIYKTILETPGATGRN